MVDSADRMLAPTPAEAAQLVGLYGAEPGPGPGHPAGRGLLRFSPGNPAEARARLGLVGKRVLVFVGRLQQLKGPDVAIRALAEAVARDPMAMRDVVLAVVGGPSGPREGASEVGSLMDLATTAGVGDRVQFYPPQAHARLADFYSAAEVVLVPSRSESFGLVALEAQACGAPVVGARWAGSAWPSPTASRGSWCAVTTPPTTPTGSCRCSPTRCWPLDARARRGPRPAVLVGATAEQRPRRVSGARRGGLSRPSRARPEQEGPGPRTSNSSLHCVPLSGGARTTKT